MQRFSKIRRVGTQLAVGASIAVMTLMLPLATHALGGNTTGFSELQNNFRDTSSSAGIQGDAAPGALPKIVGNLIKQAIGLLGIILVVLIIYAGFLWMTAAGNEERVKKAKTILTNAVIGMVLIFAAYAATDFVVRALITASTTT